MCKLDWKDAYISIPLTKDSRKKIVSMVRQLVRVSLPVIWFRSCTKAFYKTPESAYINIAKTEHKDNHLPGRHASFKQDSRRGSNDQGQGNFPVTASGLCYKSEKICIDSNTKNNFFRSDSKFDQINIVTDPRDVTKNISIMLGNV